MTYRTGISAARRSRRELLVLTCGALALDVHPGLPATQQRKRQMVYQLRIYEIFERSKEAFHTRFRDHAARIMARHGFDIAAMWEAHGEQGPEFVYLLRWPDEATLQARWASFMADEEWSRIKAETSKIDGNLVGRIQSRILDLVDYSASV